MTIENWWQKARTLANNLATDGSYQVSNSRADSYKDVRDVIFNDRHHAPYNTKADVLLEQLRGWMTSVKAGTYGNKFEPKHEGIFTPVKKY